MLYSFGVGALAVVALLFLALMAVWMYGQFIWTFTHWDLADVDTNSLEQFGYFMVLMTFAAGSFAGFWCFSGAAWRRKPQQKRTHHNLR